MKKIYTFLLLISMTISGHLFAQNSYETIANEYLKTKGEVILSFSINEESELSTITKNLSIVNYDENSKIVKVMADKKQFSRFLEKNIPFTVVKEDNIIGYRTMTSDIANRGTFSYPLTAYPTYADYVTMMNDFATDYPTMCQVENIGTTTEGDKSILFVKLSDNVSADEQEPRVMFTSSMHGDEIAGFPMMLNLIDYLLDAYSDTNHSRHLEIKNLLDNNEVWINPMANPDGTYRNSSNNTSVANATRGNANNVDLNRNYPDPDDGPHPDGNAYQIETQRFMTLSDSKHFVLSANFHGGIELMSYPWDTYAGASPDEDYYIYLSEEYRDHAQADSPAGYFDDRSNGITNGFAWYEVQGGRQDYMIVEKKGREITVELSAAKTPAASQLVNFWNYNRDALIAYLNQVNYGIRGVVTDAVTSQPLDAKITVIGRESYENWTPTELPEGDYYRPIKAGTYDILYEAPCYQSVTLTGVVITDHTAVVRDVQLTPIGNTIPTGLIASNVGATMATLNWDPVQGAEYDIRYRQVGGTTWTEMAATTNTTDITGLTILTQYEAQVRSKCSGGASSSYSTSINFTTTDTPACSGINSLPYTESFESGFGVWTNATGDDIQWTRDSGGTPSTGTGPSTGQDGSFYLFTEASTNVTPAGSPNKVALLDSPCVDLSGASGVLLEFGYHMFGTAIGTIDVLISTNDGGSYSSVWTQTGTQGNVWNQATVNLDAYAGSIVRLQFKGTTGTSWSSDLAIDNINITSVIPDTEVPSVPTNLVASNIGASTVDLSWTASTDNIGVTGYDVYRDEVLLGTVANTNYNVTGLASSSAYTFSVRAKDNAGNLSLSSNTVAINTLPPPPCSGIINFPYVESFESGLGVWTNNAGDDIEWTRDSGGTPSNGTGPSTGQDGSFYLFTEASTNVTPAGSPNKVALLDSPCIDLSGVSSASLEFGYHMLGTAMGTMEVLVSNDEGLTFMSAWTQSGSQGNAWNQSTVDLTSYAGSVIRLQFKGTTGTSWSSDMAIDNINITVTTVDTEAPTAPSVLAAANITQSSVDLSWNASTDNINVTGYDVYQGATLLTTVTGTTYNVTSLSANTSYDFSVFAKDAAGNISLSSNTVNVTTLAPDTEAPTAPLNLVTSNLTQVSLTLSWGNSTDNVGVTGYDVYQGTTLLETVTGTNYDVTGLIVNTNYNFTVYAKDAAGNVSPSSNTASVTTPDTEAPTAPTNLIGSNITQISVDLSWNASTDNVAVTGYDVYQGTTLLTTLSELNYSVTGLTASTNYIFTLYAKDTAGNTSAVSNTLNITTLSPPDTEAPTAPTNLAPSNIAQTSVDLSWNAATDNVSVTGYDVYQDAALLTTVSGVSHNVTGLTANTNYAFTVYARDAAGNISTVSNTVNITTLENTITYCTSRGNNVTFEYIDYVGIGGIVNSTGANGGYADFTSQIGNVPYGANTIVLSVGFVGSAYTEHWRVWIDYNRDGTFGASEEIVAGSTSSAGNLSYNFTVPTSALAGNTRMRVSMQYNSPPTACQTFTYGEVEDYTVNIGGSSARTSDTARIDGELTDEATIYDFTMFPNPVTDNIINVKLVDERKASFKIINYLGQILLKGKVSRNIINVAKLPSGVYILEVNDTQRSISKKFIKE